MRLVGWAWSAAALARDMHARCRATEEDVVAEEESALEDSELSRGFVSPF